MKLLLPALLLSLAALTPLRAQSTYEEWVERGLALAQTDSLRAAEQAFKEALKRSPADYRNALLFTNLGRVQEALYWQAPDTLSARRREQMAAAALDSYGLALGLSPDGVPIRAARAQMYLRMQLWEKAAADFSRILDLRPDNLVARNYRAYAYFQLRRFDEARMDYERILQRDAQNYDARLGMALTEQRMGHRDRAIEQLGSLMQACPDSIQLYSVRAAVYAENRQPELALLDLDRAVEAEPHNTNYLLARAYLHLEQGNRLRARADFRRAIALGVPEAALRKELEECR